MLSPLNPASTTRSLSDFFTGLAAAHPNDTAATGDVSIPRLISHRAPERPPPAPASDQSITPKTHLFTAAGLGALANLTAASGSDVALGFAWA
jgi:hypothetical protein